jgi:hypothetical protein
MVGYELLEDVAVMPRLFPELAPGGFGRTLACVYRARRYLKGVRAYDVAELADEKRPVPVVKSQDGHGIRPFHYFAGGPTAARCLHLVHPQRYYPACIYPL